MVFSVDNGLFSSSVKGNLFSYYLQQATARTALTKLLSSNTNHSGLTVTSCGEMLFRIYKRCMNLSLQIHAIYDLLQIQQNRQIQELFLCQECKKVCLPEKLLKHFLNQKAESILYQNMQCQELVYKRVILDCFRHLQMIQPWCMTFVTFLLVLVLWKPRCTSKTRDHIKYLKRRMDFEGRQIICF